MNNRTIPVFYACDDTFVKYTIVSISSLIKNASRDFDYRIYILHTSISDRMKSELEKLQTNNVTISFVNVESRLAAISESMPIRDYYSKTTYYRLFIAEAFPGYDKAVYIDSDTVVQGDISELYKTDLGDSYVGACHEQAMVQVDEYGTYAERVVGISRHEFFNAGILLINCRAFREKRILEQFVRLLGEYNFVVTQDEDYLNIICRDRVVWLDQRWNTEVFGEIGYPTKEANIIHYIMTSKPWHYADCRHADIFWGYAKDTSVYGEIKAELDAYTDEQRKNDEQICENLMKLAIKETNREDNYLNRLNSTVRSADRVAIVKKIEEYESAGKFDIDAEDDPPSRTLMPDEIKYVKKGIFSRIKTAVAFGAARLFARKLMRRGELIIKEIRGIEHF